MCFLLKNYSLVKVMCPLIRCCYMTRFFLWNTNTDRNGINKQNTYTPNTQRKITLERVSTKVIDTPLFKTTPLILPNPPYFLEKSEKTPFLENFKKPSPLYKGGKFSWLYHTKVLKMIQQVILSETWKIFDRSFS